MSNIKGITNTHSLGISFPNFSRQEMLRVLNSYDYYSWWEEKNNNEKEIILTDLHELDHFCHLVSSPFGVLLFRIQHVLVRDVAFLADLFNKVGIQIDNTGQPLVDWLIEKGLKKYKEKSRKKDELIIKYILIEIVPGIRCLMDLFQLLTADSLPKKFEELTVQDFCSLLNNAYGYLRRRNDIDIDYGELGSTEKKWDDIGFIWDSKLPPNTKVFDKKLPFLSMGSLLETLAYTREYKLIYDSFAYHGEEIIKEETSKWLKNRVPKKYRDHVYFLINLFKNPSTTRRYIYNYLCSKIDICSGSSQIIKTRHYVEDEWSFFFYHTLKSKKIWEFHEQKKQQNISSIKNIISRDRLFGKRSNWRNTDLKKVLINNNIHLLKMEKMFLKGLKRRYSVMASEAKGATPKLTFSDLVWLIEYKDTFKPNLSEEIFSSETWLSDIIKEVIYGVLHTIIPDIVLRILEGKPILIPTDKFEKIENFFKTEFSKTFEHNAMNDAMKIAKQLFEEEFQELIFPGIKIIWYIPIKN